MNVPPSFLPEEEISQMLRFLGAFAKSRKVPITVVTSVHLSACISAAPTGQKCAKFFIGGFYKNAPRSSECS
jgi:hypothetical protein